METEDVCLKCKKIKFDVRGIVLARGLKVINCVNCNSHAINYVDGQERLCHECARKLGICVMCGNLI